jgi:hypothetical protein
MGRADIPTASKADVPTAIATAVAADIPTAIATGIPTCIAASGVSTGTGTCWARLAWFGSNHAPCLAFDPLSTDYY